MPPSIIELGHDFWVFNSRSAITYNADNWDLTAHVIYGIAGEISPGGSLHNVKIAPDYVNLDLTATKTLGKWEVGAVGFGSWDVSGISDCSDPSIVSSPNSLSAVLLATTSRASACKLT